MQQKTQFLSLYLYTPKSGYPGIKSPFLFTKHQIQKPK